MEGYVFPVSRFDREKFIGFTVYRWEPHWESWDAIGQYDELPVAWEKAVREVWEYGATMITAMWEDFRVDLVQFHLTDDDDIAVLEANSGYVLFHIDVPIE